MEVSFPLLRRANEVVREVLVLGGGLAGASAALELAKCRMPVRLLERESAPHQKVCGEFLSIEAQSDLQRLGIDTARLGAIPVDMVRLVRGSARVEARLAFTAHGISRKRLDEAVLEAALEQGAEIERGVKVTGLRNGEVDTSAGARRASQIFLATGKHDIRGAKRSGREDDDGFIGFKMHWRIAPRQRAEVGNAVELVLFDGGYAGLQRVADDILNTCLLVRRSRFLAIGATWEKLLEELMRNDHIAHRLGDAVALFARPLAIAGLPYGYICSTAASLPAGVFPLGDQAALTAPLTGDGMAIALRSARLAVACQQAGLDPAEYCRRVREAVVSQVGRAMILQNVAGIPCFLPLAMGLLRIWPALLGRLADKTRLADRSAT